MPRVGSSDEYAWFRRQPLREDDLLLVAAGQGADELVHAGRPDPQLVHVARAERALRDRWMNNRETAARGSAGSFDAIEVEHEPVLMTILGHVGDAQQALQDGLAKLTGEPARRISPASA
jgi:hypothetical protein